MRLLRHGRTLPLVWAGFAVVAGVGALAAGTRDVPTDPPDARRLVTNPVPAVAAAPARPTQLPRERTAALIESLKQRDAVRAYEGAPPVITHAIRGLDVRTCRACHATGLVAGAQVARMASHTYLTNCTQCHVEAENADFPGRPVPENSFTPVRSQGTGGARALSGAPPNIPHTVFMRTNCVSCHGTYGYPGLQPDHLDRQNCVQCHAPSAHLDQLSPAFGTPSP